MELHSRPFSIFILRKGPTKLLRLVLDLQSSCLSLPSYWDHRLSTTTPSPWSIFKDVGLYFSISRLILKKKKKLNAHWSKQHSGISFLRQKGNSDWSLIQIFSYVYRKGNRWIVNQVNALLPGINSNIFQLEAFTSQQLLNNIHISSSATRHTRYCKLIRSKLQVAKIFWQTIGSPQNTTFVQVTRMAYIHSDKKSLHGPGKSDTKLIPFC